MSEKNEAVSDKTYFHDEDKSRDTDAGAGAVGFLMAALLGLIACALYLIHQYGMAMTLMSIAMLFYNEGSEIWILMKELVKTFYSQSHITESASNITAVGSKLKREARKALDSKKFSTLHSIEDDSKLLKFLQFLSQDYNLQKTEKDKKLFLEKIEEVVHSHYFMDTHDQYSQHINTLEFTSSIMPLWGIVGTLYVLIGIFQDTDFNALDISIMMNEVGFAMKSTLYGALFAVIYKIFAGRLKKRRTALEYDFDELVNNFNILIKKDQK